MGVFEFSEGNKEVKLAISTICIIGLLIFCPRDVYSCSCVNIGTPRQELKKAKAVFIGEVVEIYSGSGDEEYPAIVKLKVESYWKGIKNRDTIEVLSDLGTRSCLSVPLKGRYVVYAYKRGKNLITHGCTRTKKIEDAAEDLRELGESKKADVKSDAPPNNLLLSPLSSSPQQSENALYVESWGKGKQQIQEQSFTIELNASKPKFETKVRDASGKERYKLTVWLRTNQSNAQPPSGYLELVEKGLIGFKDTNLLKPSNDPYQDYFTGEDFIAVLDPAMQGERCTPANGCAPFFIKRVIRVKGFYCVVQVIKYNDSPASMSVHVELTNKVDSSLIQRRG